MRIVKRTAGDIVYKLFFSSDENKYVSTELPNSFFFVFEYYVLSAKVIIRELFDRFLHPLRDSHNVNKLICCVIKISDRCL